MMPRDSTPPDRSRSALDDLLRRAGLTPEPVRDSGGMLFFGMNAPQDLRRLITINDRPVRELETLMRPGNVTPEGSVSGFLGADESLVGILARDAAVVLAAGLSHVDLAGALAVFTEAPIGSDFDDDDWESLMLGQPGYQRMLFESAGLQYSPFGDGAKCSDVTYIRHGSNDPIAFTRLHPVLIARYGFYEGMGSDYRLAPERIIAAIPELATEVPDLQAIVATADALLSDRGLGR